MRLAIISSHPIQYNAPWFKRLAAHQEHTFKVFYTWSQSESGSKFDPGFKKEISWDIPLLEGYDYSFVKNIAPDPGSHHFNGIDNPDLISILKIWEPDAILVMGWSFKSHLRVIRYFHGKIPVLFRGDSTLLDKYGFLKSTVRSIFLKWVYSYVDFAFYVGRNNKNYFLAYGLKENQLIYAPHAIENKRFEEPEQVYKQKANQLRNQLGIADTDFVLLFAGKFEQKKNPLFLLKLSEELQAAEYKFLFVGNGDLEQTIFEKSTKDSRIRVLGFQNQSEMPVIYRIANLFILPSKGPEETWGLALNEAMASGIPVMASTKTGGAIDLIEDEVNGKIIDIDNTIDAVNYIRQLSLDADFYKKTVNENSKKINFFTFQHIEKSIIRSLEHLQELNGKN